MFQTALARVEPFHRPSSLETQQLLVQISRDDAAIAEIDAQLRELFQRRLQYQHQKALRRSLLAPVRRLTFDVLVNIFEQYVNLGEGDPWVVAHVSRTWRSAALSTPTLWTGIHLELEPEYRELPNSRRIGGKEYCATVKQLDLAMRRSSNNLLQIKLASPPAIPNVVRAHIPVMLHMVSHRMDRWASLEVDGAIVRLPGLNVQPLESLERLEMNTKDTSLLPLINETAVKLKSFTTTQLGLERFERAVWWETLEELDVTIPIDSSMLPQTASLNNLLSRTQSLRSFKLDFHQMQRQSTLPILLPSLRRLELYDIPQLMPFSAPLLTHLHIAVCKKSQGANVATQAAPLPTPSSPIVFEHLIHLTFKHPTLAPLAMIVAPRLEELVISPQIRIIAPGVNDNAIRAIWNLEKTSKAERPLLMPSVLRLEDLHVSANVLLQLLQIMNDLKELRIEWLRTDYGAIFQGLAATSTSTNKGANCGIRTLSLCPQLRSLGVHDSSTLRDGDTLPTRRSLAEIARVRQELGHPLKSVVCRWPHGDEMEEYRL